MILQGVTSTTNQCSGGTSSDSMLLEREKTAYCTLEFHHILLHSSLGMGLQYPLVWQSLPCEVYLSCSLDIFCAESGLQRLLLKWANMAGKKNLFVYILNFSKL